MYAAVCFFKEAISTNVKITTATVDAVPNEIGKYITPIINEINKKEFTLPSNFSIDDFFSNVIKNRQPAAISQNLVGIRKYAADLLIG